MHRGGANGGWDDLRYVLAVAETGSVAAAARALGVNHATVLRRVAAFEERHGRPVFDRTSSGYAVLPERLAVIEAARAAERAVRAAGQALSGGAAGGPRVRVTSTDTFTMRILPPLVARLAAEDGIAIELATSNAPVDLGRLGADLTVRPAMRLPGDLVGERAGILGFSAYAASGEEGAPWLRLTGALVRSRPAEWLSGLPEAALGGNGADSFLVLAAMAEAGLGRAILPRCVGDATPGLVRVPAAMPDMTVPIWVARHADLSADGPLARLSGRIARALLANGRLVGDAPLLQASG